MRNRRRTPGWFPASSMVSANKDYRAPGSAGGRRFLSTEHLATEAVAAYVDGELRMNAYMRASQHLEMCAQCRAEVDAQSSARAALRRSGAIAMPAGLLGALNQIPTREIDLRATAGNPAEVSPEEPLLGAPGFPVHRRRNR
ncbi:MAG TPA: zf-HC2 domain-containing protein [Williamsia sp.]